MKKSLLAIAIAAAVPAVASAQVTVGGIMDGGFNSVTTKQGTETTVNQTGGNAAGALASNRLFFRGTEKIGGMTAGFHYELGMDAGGTGDLSTTGGVRRSIQIKFREGGDDVIFEILRDVDRIVDGRDLVSKADYYIVVDRHGIGRVFKTEQFKDLARQIKNAILPMINLVFPAWKASMAMSRFRRVVSPTTITGLWVLSSSCKAWTTSL